MEFDQANLISSYYLSKIDFIESSYTTWAWIQFN